MSRIIVTGGAGRLGRSVVAALAAEGHEVTSLDREALDGLPARQVAVDLLDAGATSAVFSDIRPAAVVHLAAIAVPGALPDPDTYRINTQLVWSVLQASLDAGAEKMLLASSPTVMGYHSPSGWKPDYLPLDEDHPVAPWNGYGASKVAMEQIVQMAVRQHGGRMSFGVFRPCYVIAPEEWAGAPTQQGHTVAERISDPALSAVALFNYVDARDAGAFVAAWVERAADVPNGSTFFVGAPDALCESDTATAIRSFLPAAAGAADQLTGSQSMFSSARAEELLGWRARHLWRDELVRTPDTAGATG
ncbi:NAD-dependent epimerase/dehydratase family protein [Microbacterium halophytorum]|uniref:NAD-dependent epimerase/dehydratase family protein n=1 Tax=Microbacterium halophytorum TaxID=2067568 RepID=UPI000CFD2523|nr:NAD(P)-dependent oxidoreductase [Microbacterium halophytorum]